jgi:ribosomal protein L9
LDAEEAKIKSEIENLLEKLNKKAVTIEMLQSKLCSLFGLVYLFPSLY